MATLLLTGFALFLLFLMSFQSLLEWQVPLRFSVKIRHTNIYNGICRSHASQKPRINRDDPGQYRYSIPDISNYAITVTMPPVRYTIGYFSYKDAQNSRQVEGETLGKGPLDTHPRERARHARQKINITSK